MIATNLKQSKRLLSLGLKPETADMWWNFYSITYDFGTTMEVPLKEPTLSNFNWFNREDNIPAWSLSALLSLMPQLGAAEPYLRKIHYLSEPTQRYIIQYSLCNMTHEYGNPIDAAVEMIEWLVTNKHINNK